MRVQSFRRMLPIILLAVFVYPVSGYATEWIAYDKAAFVKAQEAGKTVLVAVHADW